MVEAANVVLVVDDNKDMREATTMLLQAAGHQVIEAADGAGALKALASGRTFSMVVLDMMMPLMDGATFLLHKAKSAQAAVPVVVFSCSIPSALQGLPGVTAVASKIDGIEGLLAAVRFAIGAEPGGHVPV